MQTVAFYSYKGGVGRSLLLADAAWFLAAHGKGVVALDLDFEAPGLHYKLGSEGPRSGAVSYLLATAEGNGSAPPFDEYVISVPVYPVKGWIRLMPAGPAPSPSYWSALKKLGDRLQFDDPSGRGFMALLDLKARIADELKPDYLLIDARTGVTGLGGLVTTVLADTVVCMFTPNRESLDGTLAVAEALKRSPRLTKQKPIRIVLLLSRTPASWRKKRSRLDELEIYFLPQDETLGPYERTMHSPKLYKAYLTLFHKLFPEPGLKVLDLLTDYDAVMSAVNLNLPDPAPDDFNHFIRLIGRFRSTAKARRT